MFFIATFCRFVEAFERAKSQVDLLWSHMVFGCVELIKKNAGRDMNLAALELMEQLVLYSQSTYTFEIFYGMQLPSH